MVFPGFGIRPGRKVMWSKALQVLRTRGSIIYAISDLEDDWVGSLFTKILDVSNNCFSTDQMGEQVSWIPWQIMPGDGGWDRLLVM